MKLNLCWPTPIFDVIVDEISDQDLQQAVSLTNRLASSMKSEAMTNVGGWQSEAFSFGNHIEYDVILAKVQKHFALIEQEINVKFRFNNYWVNVNRKGDRNIEHVHHYSAFSGVVYINAQKDQGDIIFRNPLEKLYMFGLWPVGLRDYSHRLVDPHVVTPSTKQLLLFASNIPHEVLENQTDIPRISLAFNLDVVR